MIQTVISGTGSYIPEQVIANRDFLQATFYDQQKQIIETDPNKIIQQFQKITNIEERRYGNPDLVTSDLAYFAAEKALQNAGIDRETLDAIIVAHNFGDVSIINRRSDLVPSLASRVKYKLGIQNPASIAFDLIFGCPGWLQAVIQADYQIKAGQAKRILVIGAEMLSRVSDPHDRDSMIYADGAGAIILEGRETMEQIGIIAHASRTDSLHESKLLEMKGSNHPDDSGIDIYLKMQGRKLYEYALNTVPVLVKECLDKSNLNLSDIKKILIHQANEKMDEAILERIFTLYGIQEIPAHIMPMTINKLGNSSVATLPTLLDLLLSKQLPNQSIEKGDLVLFASVGAGMNVNALAYRF